MKVLITGGSGFIGGFLADELNKQGHHVVILTNDQSYHGEFDTIYADITNREAMLAEVPTFDVVYHLAGVLGTSELLTKAYEASQINILGAVNILDGALKNNTKVVHITKPNCWLNTYSITKYASESFARMYHEQFGLPTVSIKWYNVYGPNQSFHCQKAVPFFIKWALKDEDIQIWGNGEQTADFIHAVDAARATLAIAADSTLEGTTVDVGSGEETTVNTLAKLIVEKAHSHSQIVHLPMRPGETPNTKLAADMTVLNQLGFEPLYTLPQGLDETVAWYREHLK